MIFNGYFYSILYAAICLGIGFLLYKLRCSKAVTRKIVHILIGFEWVILYRCFGGGIHFLIVCLLFLILLLLSHRKKLLPMIESDGDNSPGTVYYCVAMSIMAVITLFVPDMILPFGIGVFCTSLGDGFAGLMGQLMSGPRNAKIFGKKTIYGSLFNFVICQILIGVFNATFNLGMHTGHIVVIAFFATELELFTGRGLDNITVTLGSSLLSYFIIAYSGTSHYIIPILATPAFIAFAYKKRALTAGGIITAIIVDIAISISLGNFGFCILSAFFVGGIITDKIKKSKYKRGQSVKNAQKSKPECRSSLQVLANSLVPTIAAMLYALTLNKVFVVIFVASFAEALADTAASGIGMLCGRAYDVFRLKPCTSGLSGGMSVLGTFASLVATASIAFIALLFDILTVFDLAIVIFAAFLGAIFDSMLGSLVQVKYRCIVCNSIVESKTHCDAPCVHKSGIAYVDNNVVNFLSTIFSALSSALIYLVLL